MKNIFNVLSELQELISETEDYPIRGDLVRMYNELLSTTKSSGDNIKDNA